MILNEATRNQILDLSKDSTTSFERFKRRTSISDVKITRISILEIAYLSQQDLTIFFEVNGKYRVTLQLLRFMEVLRSYYRANYQAIDKQGGISNSKLLRKIVGAVLSQALNSSDVRVDCTCPDFTYRFSYVASIGQYKFGDQQGIPAKIRNPQNNGSVCKHLARVLSRPSSWKAKVVTGILSVVRNNPELLTNSIK